MQNFSNKKFINKDLYYVVYNTKSRVIYAPCAELKRLQREFMKKIKKLYPLDISTRKAAQLHTSSKWILKIDIKDFYNSVPYHDIEKVVEKVCDVEQFANVNYYLELCTYEQKLPTGAPTSSYIANACFRNVDFYIKSLSNSLMVNYSRYMDDLIFSADDKAVLNYIESKVRACLNKCGYQINEKKLVYICENKQQNVLGLVVNGNKIRLSKEYKRKVRAMVFNSILFLIGLREKSTQSDSYYKYYLKWQGVLSYLYQVDKKFHQQILDYEEKLLKKFCVNFSYP